MPFLRCGLSALLDFTQHGDPVLRHRDGRLKEPEELRLLCTVPLPGSGSMNTGDGGYSSEKDYVISLRPILADLDEPPTPPGETRWYFEAPTDVLDLDVTAAGIDDLPVGRAGKPRLELVPVDRCLICTSVNTNCSMLSPFRSPAGLARADLWPCRPTDGGRSAGQSLAPG